MKTIRWNIGLMIIKLGYEARKLSWSLRFLLTIGYFIRGEVPQKHWFNYGKF